jgi:outer membrane protein assembly factor BamB
MRVMTTAGTAVAVLATAGIGLAADWPQWQGPDRNSMSSERGLLQEWAPEGPPLAWKVDGLGGGDSAPSVADGRIFGMANRGSDEVVWALSEPDGRSLWVTRLGPAFEQSGFPQGKEGPAATPTVDGERLYVMGLAGNVACLKVRDGALVWQRSLRDDFSAPLPTWSFRESPLVPVWAHPVIANGRLYLRDQDLLLAYDIRAR